MKKIFESSALAIIFGFIAYGTYFTFSGLLSKQTTKFIDNFEGAFLGAFFAFIFVRLGEALTKIYNRHSKNDYVLIVFEHNFNECLSILSDNLYIIDGFIGIIEKLEKHPNEPILYANKLHEIPIDKESLISLTNLELINNIATSNVAVRKLNNSMETIISTYTQTKDAFVSGTISQKTYYYNFVSMKSAFLDLKKYTIASRNEIVELLAATRVLIKEAPLLARIIRKTLKTKYSRNFKAKFGTEMEALKKEIEMVSKESQDRINRIETGKIET